MERKFNFLDTGAQSSLTKGCRGSWFENFERRGS